MAKSFCSFVRQNAVLIAANPPTPAEQPHQENGAVDAVSASELPFAFALKTGPPPIAQAIKQ
ncbi:MAG: hypothetical protein ACREBY_00640 [Polaromonas sp.]